MQFTLNDLQNQQLSIRELEKFEKAQPYEQAHEYLVHLMTDRPTRSEVFQEYSRKCTKEASSWCFSIEKYFSKCGSFLLRII